MTRREKERREKRKDSLAKNVNFFSSSFIFSARWLVMIHFQPLNERLDVDRSPSAARLPPIQM